MSELGHYKVTVHRRRGWDQPLSRTFPFGQWAEIGFWLDAQGAGEGDSVAISFHPLPERRWQQDEHSGRWLTPAELDEASIGLGEIDGGDDRAA